jgi:hypothetical protein
MAKQSEIVTEDFSAEDRVRAEKEERFRDISKYIMAHELESRAAIYESDDPTFITHVRRADKYHQQHKDCIGKEWVIEIKGKDETTGKYPRLFFSRAQEIPTPEEMRSQGAFGNCRFFLTYFDPFKENKGGGRRGGFVTIKSEDFEIFTPAATYERPARGSSIPPVSGVALPQPGFMDSFSVMLQNIQQMSAQTQTMVMQAATAQMDILANRSKIVEEGIEKGKLLQKVEELERRNAELLERSKLSPVDGSDDETEEASPGGLAKVLTTALEKGAELAESYINHKFGTEEEVETEGGPTIPPQQ